MAWKMLLYKRDQLTERFIYGTDWDKRLVKHLAYNNIILLVIIIVIVVDFDVFRT